MRPRRNSTSLCSVTSNDAELLVLQQTSLTGFGSADCADLDSDADGADGSNDADGAKETTLLGLGTERRMCARGDAGFRRRFRRRPRRHSAPGGRQGSWIVDCCAILSSDQ